MVSRMSKKGISNGIIEKNGKHYMLCGDREVEMEFIKLEKKKGDHNESK